MIRKVSFRNFKAYRSLDMELEPFTVLVGPNASGKTTLLEGLEIVSAAGMLGDREEQGPLMPLSVQSFGAGSPAEVTIAGTWDGTQGWVRAVGVKRESSKEGEERLLFTAQGEWGGNKFPVDPIASLLGATRPSWFGNFSQVMSSTRVLRLEPEKLVAASYSDDAIPRVDRDGSGLASVLAYLKLSQDDVFNDIELALRQIVPTVRRIRIERASVEQTAMRTISLDEERHQIPEKRRLWGDQIVLDMKGARGVPASAAGEGTLMALGLLTVLKGPSHPKLLLLDDIELSLHPAAQAKLIEVLRTVQAQNKDLQIVATSHSPFILNYLDPKEVRMTFLAENGFARCEKLTAHPEFEKWKDLMTPGEFWSTVGESWVEKAGETSVHE